METISYVLQTISTASIAIEYIDRIIEIIIGSCRRKIEYRYSIITFTKCNVVFQKISELRLVSHENQKILDRFI